jgi:hypothetical protein
MPSKSDEITVKLTGTGLSFDRKVSEEVASKIITFIIGGGTGTLGGGTPSTANSAAQPNALPGAAASGMTPKQFLATKKPDNDYERVACLGYYLTNARTTPHFKTADISKIATEAAYKFSNPANSVHHASVTYKFLAPAGGGKKQMTALGEAVVEAMPDRDKVRAALTEHKPAAKRRGRGKKRAK